MGFEEIEVTISPDGEVQVEVRGVTGQQCLSRTADLERALGGEVVRREMKPEAYKQAEQQESQWQRRSW
jgi:hypothetical protein